VRPPREALLAKARELAGQLSADLTRPVRLTVTDNRSTMVSFRREGEGLALRVHHMFLSAPEDVIRALTDYADRGGKNAGTVIDRFVRQHATSIRSGSAVRSSPRLTSSGRWHELRELFDRINAAEFAGSIKARIGWGRVGHTRRRRSIRMGVYDHLTRTIRIHPALDRPEVPSFFVAYIVFHEMLHQALPGAESNGRRQHHGPEFRRRERAYADYARAIAWERANLPMLLGRPAAARALPVD
jgi:hypothetical protein